MASDKAIDILIDSMEEISLPPKDLDKIKQVLKKNKEEDSIEILELDSLGTMEFCIAIELNHNIVITPEDIFLCAKVSELIKIIKHQIVD